MSDRRRRPIDDVKQMSQPQLSRYVEQMSDDYRKVMTIDEYFDQQTGVWAVVQKQGKGPESRLEVQLNSGVRPDLSARARAKIDKATQIREWAEKEGYEAAPHGKLISPTHVSKGRKEGKLTFEVAPDGQRTAYNPKTSNAHHAEMKVLRWAKDNGYEVVAMSPTRGCCEQCQQALKTAFKERFDEIVPKSRQTPQAFKQYMERDVFGETRAPPAETPKPSPAEAIEKAGKGEAAAPAEGGRSAAAKSLEEVKLIARSERLLKLGGHALTVLDTMATAADVAVKLKDGKPQEATKSVVDFGARMYGGAVGAEFGAEIGAIGGSIVPGAGTAVGAAAGGLIGGIVGASLGEEAAKKLFQPFEHGGKGSKDSGVLASASIDPKLTDDSLRQYADPKVRDLQHYMYEADYSSPQVNFVCTTVSARLIDTHRENPSATVADVFNGLAERAVEMFLSPNEGKADDSAVKAPPHADEDTPRQRRRLPPKDGPKGEGVADWTLLGPRGG